MESVSSYIICKIHGKMKIQDLLFKNLLRISRWQQQNIKCGPLVSMGACVIAQVESPWSQLW